MTTTIAEDAPKTAPKFTFVVTMSEAELAAELKRVQAEFGAGNIPFDLVAECLDEYTRINTLRIRAEEQAKAKAGAGGAFTIKVSEKGCVQMRGVPGTNVKFGFTLYATTIQWLYKPENAEKILKFVADNAKSLSWGKQA